MSKSRPAGRSTFKRRPRASTWPQWARKLFGPKHALMALGGVRTSALVPVPSAEGTTITPVFGFKDQVFDFLAGDERHVDRQQHHGGCAQASCFFGRAVGGVAVAKLLMFLKNIHPAGSGMARDLRIARGDSNPVQSPDGAQGAEDLFEHGSGKCFPLLPV